MNEFVKKSTKIKNEFEKSKKNSLKIIESLINEYENMLLNCKNFENKNKLEILIEDLKNNKNTIENCK